MNDFEMQKWYMDAADEKGRAFIGYSASLRWKSLHLRYNGFTYYNGKKGSKILKRNSFSASRLPILEDNKLSWNFLQAKGIWSGTDHTIEKTLLKNNTGEIDWFCLFPKSVADVQIGEDRMKSAGYVEKIKITIAPWHIPIHQLHWGRFLSKDHTLIWIQWIGPVPKTLLYHNSREIATAEISTELIIFESYSLALKNKVMLRKGSLLSTVFARFSLLARVFPKNSLQLQENKWVSDGLLAHHGNLISHGKAIHEFVVWQ
jgi:hypothetical protein